VSYDLSALSTAAFAESRAFAVTANSCSMSHHAHEQQFLLPKLSIAKTLQAQTDLIRKNSVQK
jgi:hypothetical protein